MIAVDTNVLIRFFVADDREQANRAKALFETAQARGESVYVGKIALAEAVWVLERSYGFKKLQLVEWLNDLLRASFICLEGEDEVESALQHFKAGRANFSDYLLAVHAGQQTGGRLYTFDKRCQERDLFAVPPSGPPKAE